MKRANGKQAISARKRNASARDKGRNSLCPHSAHCGACSLIDVSYEDQLARKQGAVEDLFRTMVDVSACRPILGMDEPFHYRYKVASPFAPAQGGSGIATGMYAKGTHRLVNTDGCLLEHEGANRVVASVRALMKKWHIAPYDEDTGTGFLRHVVVRAGHNGREMLVTIVTNAREFPSSRSFCRELVRRVPDITTVVQNVNMRKTNVILGEEEHTLYGPGFILDELCGLTFRISSQSFYQVNGVQTEALYRTAIEQAHLDGHETVIDAYCGTGTIGLVAAASGAARVIGVDDVEPSIRDARMNARHNGINNAEFICADAGTFMRRRAAEGLSDEEAANLVVLMDPPRSGASEEFLDALCTLAPARIVYISCNPETQARDVSYLLRRSWRVSSLQPVDMFPHTDHVENIVTLEREQVGMH